MTRHQRASGRSRLPAQLHRRDVAIVRDLAPGARRLTGAVGALALGALAIGALAIGALAINRLVIKRARIESLSVGTLEIEQLVVRKRRGAGKGA